MNTGNAQFSAQGSFPVTGTSNAVVSVDLEPDGDWDLIIGNRGQNFALVNDGRGNFTDETALRLPSDASTTQDLELGDVNGDGHLDLVVGNEGRNQLLINSGTGTFLDETDARLPSSTPHDETRAAAFGDVDQDGDLDLFFANAGRTGSLSRQDRLLLNDGDGYFQDLTATHLPMDDEEAMDGKLVDLDEDGAPDIVIATYTGRQGMATPYRVFRNDGEGRFTEATSQFFPASATGHGFAVVAGDLNGDGHLDLYLGSGRSRDRLLLTQVE